jgi:hypothetical protein
MRVRERRSRARGWVWSAASLSAQDLLSGPALAILELFTLEQPVIGIAEIAQRLGISRFAVHQYVIVLVGFGYLERGSERMYRLGPLGRHARTRSEWHAAGLRLGPSRRWRCG